MVLAWQRHLTIPAFATCLTVAACSGGTSFDLPDPFRNGDRIHAEIWLSDDGGQFFRGWFDTELGVPCRAGLAEDGQYRCLPATSLGEFGSGDYDGRIFSDAACTTRAAVVHGDVGPLLAIEDGVYEVGPVNNGFLYQESAAGACSGIFPADYVELGARVPLERFVPAYESIEGTGRIVARREVMEDGAQLSIGAYDRVLDTEVRSRNRDKWVPACHASADELFWDPDCFREAAYSSYNCAAPQIAIRSGACGETVGVFDIGAPMVVARYWRAEDGSCAGNPPDPDKPVYPIVASLGTDYLADVTVWRRGGTRLREEIPMASDLTPLAPSGTIYDGAFDTPCTFAQAGDGRTRCLPATEARVSFYSDPDCRRRVVLPDSPGDACRPEVASVIRMARESLPDGRIVVVRYSASLEQVDRLYHRQDGDGRCAAGGVISPARSVHPVVEEIPAQNFVAAELAISDGRSN